MSQLIFLSDKLILVLSYFKSSFAFWFIEVWTKLGVFWASLGLLERKLVAKKPGNQSWWSNYQDWCTPIYFKNKKIETKKLWSDLMTGPDLWGLPPLGYRC